MLVRHVTARCRVILAPVATQLAGALLLSSMTFALSCADESVEPRQGPRLVLLYATCSLNRNFLSPYDSSRRFTPKIDEFAKGGRVFLRHQTESGQSGTAFASIFSGRQAPGHGIYSHPNNLPDELELIAERFRSAGYATYSWLAHLMAASRLNYGQGVSGGDHPQAPLQADDPAFLELLDELERNPQQQAFVVTAFSVTHPPYHGRGMDSFCKLYNDECAIRRHPEFRRLYKIYQKNHIAFSWDFERKADALGLDSGDRERLEQVVSLLYKADVHYLDGLFGGVIDLIAERGLLDDSIVAFTSDHGELHVRDNALFRWGHGMQLAPEVLNVPLIVRAPGAGVEPGIYQSVTRSIDVFPTLAGLAGLAPPGGAGVGVDLSAVLQGAEPEPELIALSHTALLPDFFRRDLDQYPLLAARFPRQEIELAWLGARRGDDFFELARDKLFDESGGEPSQPQPQPQPDWAMHLYDLQSDPGKRNDLFDLDRADHRSMHDLLLEYRERLVQGLATSRRNSVPPSDEDAERRLRSLGYIE